MPNTYVLIHGSWHGSWCWRGVARALAAAGHTVVVPNLSGCGHSAHLLDTGTAIDLSTHVRDVADGLHVEDLADAILVGHSYGGLVALGASTSPRVAGAVLLDGYVVRQGQRGLDVWSPEKARAVVDAIGRGETVRRPLGAAMLGVSDEAAQQWLAERLTPHPLACYTQPLAVDPARVRGAYVRCTQGPLVPSFEPSERLAAEAGWPVLPLAAPHDAMLTHPAATADVLLEAGALVLRTLSPDRPGPSRSLPAGA